MYGIPCHVRNARFLEALLSDVGVVSNYDSLESSSEILDVLSLMVFTKSVESIKSKINVCLDDIWISLMLIKEVSSKSDQVEFSSDGDSFRSGYVESSFSLE